MKKQLFCILFAFIGYAGYAQTYNMSNGPTINTCSGTFYDATGSSGQYNNNESFTQTFCSSMPGAQITFNFSSFNSEQCCDHLYIYDGSTIAGLLRIQIHFQTCQVNQYQPGIICQQNLFLHY